jgi:hypothetical protein
MIAAATRCSPTSAKLLVVDTANASGATHESAVSLMAIWTNL